MNNEKQWYTGEVITADELNRLEGRVTQVIEKTYRPNLLINSDFRNPINQRGQTKYEGSTNGGVYTIDRWRLDVSSSARTVEVLDGFVRLTNNHATYNTTFSQHFEKPLPSGDYTLTVKVKSLSGTMTVRVGETTINLVEGMNYVTVNGSVDYVYIGMYTNSSIDIEYIKLEQGSIATPLVPRLYGEELALCQRYYVKCTAWHTTVLARGDNILTNVFFPNLIMRTNPTVINAEVQIAGITTSNVVANQSFNTVVSTSSNKTGVTVSFACIKTVNFGIACITKDMELDAEIY